jgi:hypothetical protein
MLPQCRWSEGEHEDIVDHPSREVPMIAASALNNETACLVCEAAALNDWMDIIEECVANAPRDMMVDLVDAFTRQSPPDTCPGHTEIEVLALGKAIHRDLSSCGPNKPDRSSVPDACPSSMVGPELPEGADFFGAAAAGSLTASC